MAFSVLLGSGFFFGAEAYHRESYDDKVEDRFIVSPVKIELDLRPGQEFKQPMTVINRLGKKANFTVIKEGLIKNENGELVETAIDWIEPEIENFSLEQGERMILDIKINVPEGVRPGGYYAAILVANEGEDLQEGKSGIEFVSRVGLSALITIPGKVKEEGSITKFSTDKFFYLTGPVDFKTIFQNQGNIHLAPEGEITVRNFLGSIVAQIPLRSWTVLPNSSREWEARWNRKWILGFYSADLNLHYGSQNQQVAKQRLVFWAFPWHLLILILMILGVLYYLLRKLSEKVEIKIKRKKADQIHQAVANKKIQK